MKHAEERIRILGAELFRALFGSDDARDLWATVRARLNDLRVEISTGIEEANSLPWELLRDPKTDIVLSLHANAFVRVHSNPAQRFSLPAPATKNTAIRILLAICRPAGQEDVPFRSVAGRLIKGLEQGKQVELTVLRPCLCFPASGETGISINHIKSELPSLMSVKYTVAAMFQRYSPAGAGLQPAPKRFFIARMQVQTFRTGLQTPSGGVMLIAKKTAHIRVLISMLSFLNHALIKVFISLFQPS
ncbi:MAG: hypothetical protein GY862_05540 [Gammaproteobacteria bacterium]|nr:hypothetical protein [Gammaproteobacteria bacterium]